MNNWSLKYKFFSVKKKGEGYAYQSVRVCICYEIVMVSSFLTNTKLATYINMFMYVQYIICAHGGGWSNKLHSF